MAEALWAHNAVFPGVKSLAKLLAGFVFGSSEFNSLAAHAFHRQPLGLHSVNICLLNNCSQALFAALFSG